jgi:hypothetical protein
VSWRDVAVVVQRSYRMTAPKRVVAKLDTGEDRQNKRGTT